MSKIWSDTEAEIVFKMTKDNYTYRDISDVLGEGGFNRSANAVRKFYNRYTKVDEEETSTINYEAANKSMVMPQMFNSAVLYVNGKEI